MAISRIIAGGVGVVLGLALIIGAFFISFVLSIYGVIILGVGVAIFLNNKEDEIEQIKSKKDIKRKKVLK